MRENKTAGRIQNLALSRTRLRTQARFWIVHAYPEPCLVGDSRSAALAVFDPVRRCDILDGTSRIVGRQWTYGPNVMGAEKKFLFGRAEPLISVMCSHTHGPVQLINSDPSEFCCLT
ncbi:hypothetical protein Bbelb_184670 [Branchiostoma belcheri]|nr:hypothetical protein Bbelb_184670 [Branchiostoma belcheri]